MIRILAFAIVAALAGCSGGGDSTAAPPSTVTPPPASPPPAAAGIVATSCGSFQGSAQGPTYAFLGIAYAAPPTGAQRWKAPQAASCPAAVQPATAFGAKCPQLDRDSGAFIGNENCLTLNVWAPSERLGNTNARRPVFFFIHGGGNSIGSSSEMLAGGAATYRGDRLASVADAIVVTANYRLGPLGYLTHPQLDAETAQGTSGNYGTLDLIAALRWVRDHIANFGGDPARVLVFGQSAGGVNTCMLLASPLAAGLLHAAAILSGGCPGQSRADADAATESLATKSGCAAAADVLSCLRSRGAEELLRADPPIISVSGAQAPWQPHTDGYALPAAPLAIFNAGGQNRVPVMVSVTADETSRDIPMSLTEPQFVATVNSLFGASAPQVLAQYPVAQFGGSAWRAHTQLTTDAKFVCPARRFSRALARTQQEPVFRALFAETIDAPNLSAFGAFHGAEILFVFDNLDVAGYQAPASERALATAMQGYIARFATARDPNGLGAVAWPQYDGSADNYLVLEGGNIRPEAGLRTARCDFWDQLLPG
jgi:para-nitrobenzyl esterase